MMVKEKGAFLIVFSMVLTLLLLVSLGVLDISRQRIIAEHARFHTKLATLAAIDGYFKAFEGEKDESGNTYDCVTDNTPCVGAAVASANAYLEKADINHTVFDSVEKTDRVGYYDKATETDALNNTHYAHNLIKAVNEDGTEVDENHDMKLTVGYWVNCDNKIEGDFSGCPSDDEQKKGVEFFLDRSEYADEFRSTVTDREGTMGNPNAIRICGKWLQDSKTYALSNLFDEDSRVAPKVCAIAMAVPRHIYFVVDMSDSGQNDTIQDPYMYATCVDDYCGRFFPNEFWDGMEEKRDYPNGKNGYYRDDYVRKVVLGDDDYESLRKEDKDIHPNPKNEDESASYYSLDRDGRGVWGSGSSQRGVAYIHAFNPSGEGYPKPEPLVTIMKGVHKAIGTLRDRRITGDKAGVIFFTNGLVWPRITYLTDDLDTLYRYTDYAGELEAGTGKVLINDVNENGNNESLYERYVGHDFSQLVDYDGQSGLDRAIRFSLFPVPFLIERNADGTINYDASDSWGFSNIAEALEFAVMSMEESTCRKGAGKKCSSDNQLDPNISRSVILFSDGIQNCKYRANHEDGYTCDSEQISYYNAGIEELRKIVITNENSMRNNNIPLHVFQAGAGVGPHQVAKKKNAKDAKAGCYTDAECRASTHCDSNSFVVGNSSNDVNCAYNMGYCASEQALKNRQPFYTASHEMYELALGSGGVYVPLRDANTKEGNGKSFCGSKVYDIGDEVPPFNCEEYAEGEKILHDPQCRTLARQIQDGMNDAIGVNPYRIVDVH